MRVQCEREDGPAVLQVHKWHSLQSNLELGEVCEASISPTRQRVLFLSEHHEAALLSLVPEKQSFLPNTEVGSQSLDVQESTCGVGNSKNVTSMKHPLEAESGRHCISVFEVCPVICGVKSTAWGHCGNNGSIPFEGPLFNDLLVISSDSGIMVHAFCHISTNNQIAESIPIVGELGGKWVEWGPSNRTCHAARLPRWIDNDITSDKACSGCNLNHVGDTRCDPSEVMNRSWLRSFLIEVTASATDGKYVIMFPAKSLIPRASQIISFNILENTLAFLDFVRSNKTECGQKNSELPDCLQDRSFTSESSHCTSIECLRVFSDPSINLIGLVLISSDEICSSSQKSPRKSNDPFVIVIKLFNWGMHWMFSADLKLCADKGTCLEWVDFRFSNNFLLCLNNSGLVAIWDITSRRFVCCFDTSQTFNNLDMKYSISETSTMKSNSAMTDHLKREISYNESRCLRQKLFRSLIVASQSCLLAVIDESGVIYVFCLFDAAGVCHFLPEDSKSCCDCRSHDPWSAAGYQISSMAFSVKSFSNPEFQNLLSANYIQSTLENTDPLRSRKGLDSSDFKKSEDNWLSSFCPRKDMKHLHQCTLRIGHFQKVILPAYKLRGIDVVCLSPIGVTRIINDPFPTSNRGIRIIHSKLSVTYSMEYKYYSHGCLLDQPFSSIEESAFGRDSVPCSFGGCLYLITPNGIYVVLPPISTSRPKCFSKGISQWLPTISSGNVFQALDVAETCRHTDRWKHWQLEILDRVILYEGPSEADLLCQYNGWDLKVSRLRQMQLALHYVNINVLHRCLDLLLEVNLAEEGIFQLLLVSVYRIICRTGTDGEAVLSSRLLNLASGFATKMIRYYGLRKQTESCPNGSRQLQEMALFLETARNIQSRLSSKTNDFVSTENGRSVDSEGSQTATSLRSTTSDTLSPKCLDISNANNSDSAFSVPGLALVPSEELGLTSQGPSRIGKLISFKNIRDMVMHWENNNFDRHTVIKEALHSGRLPLAVLKLQIYTQSELASQDSSCDTFSEVQEIGKSIAYDLFMKGEIGLAIATLERLGNDLESVLRQLFLATVRRSLRLQIAEELKRHSYLRSNEEKMIEKISLIELLYPSSRFWRSFMKRKSNFQELSSSDLVALQDHPLLMLNVQHYPPIKCGDIDGVVIGWWATVKILNLPDIAENIPDIAENNVSFGYWAFAAAWLDVWDQTTFDRILLDQPSQKVLFPWESQLEYHVIHKNLKVMFDLINAIPTDVLSEGFLRVRIDKYLHVTNSGSDVVVHDHEMPICASDGLVPTTVEVPGIKIFRSSFNLPPVLWHREIMELELAKKEIFLNEEWEGIDHIIQLLARAGKIIAVKIDDTDKFSEKLHSENFLTSGCPTGSKAAFHNLVVLYCVQHDLPFLLDLYLGHNCLLQDNDSLNLLQKTAGKFQWAKWLLFSKLKGCEYEASFCNARWNLTPKTVSLSNLSSLDIDSILQTVDDMAVHKGEIAALATLMYAPIPIQTSLCTGGINRNHGASFHCTLENLHLGLQHFPTLWRNLFSSCFGLDIYGSLSITRNNLLRKSAISDYLNWRSNIFSSAGGDTSLLQMLPLWFPKSVRRLVQLFEQGPFGMQLWIGMTSSEDSIMHSIGNFILDKTGYKEVNSVSLEASIQKSIEQELYCSAEDKDFRVEHHVRRGRALAAFTHLLSKRASQITVANVQIEPSAERADMQLMLEPLQQSERSVVSLVAPLAIMNFEDSTVVASCLFLLELCGLPASMLRCDVAVLLRISSYYKSMETRVLNELAPLKSPAIHSLSNEADVALNLARALADDYTHCDYLNVMEKKQNCSKKMRGRNHSPFTALVYHLEKASLPLLEDGKTCGYSLLNHICNTSVLRSQQSEASRRWKLVTEFCQIHHLPISTKYLALLANDNDWVGFLSEAQLGGFPVDVVIELAAKEIRDPRLKTHIITVLRKLHPTKKKFSYPEIAVSSFSCEMPWAEDYNGRTELFGILSDCEKHANPGATMLRKAKDMHWSLLALIASCFSDVTSLSCFSVWLEITAARETSSIKVDDMSSKIARDVRSSVQATNRLPTSSRNLEFQYNRRNPKRRRFLETTSDCYGVDSLLHVTGVPNSVAGMAFNHSATVGESGTTISEESKISTEYDEELAILSNMVAVLCEQRLFVPLLRAFDLFMPSCSLLPFVRALQAFSQMRLSEASAHLASFCNRLNEEPLLTQSMSKESIIKPAWVVAVAVKAADAVLLTCPSVYEKKCLLQLLAAVDFGDSGSTKAYFTRLHWKLNLVEPSLCKSGDVYQWDGSMDDASLLMALEKNGRWEQARDWARQLESSDASWKSAVHHVTESQAEAMVAEWKEFLWDVPQERAALWGYCQALFIRYSFPPLQAGLFFLKHADEVGKDIPSRELHEILLLSLQWLSGTITQSVPVYPLHLLREIETRVWLLAVESESQVKLGSTNISAQYFGSQNCFNIIEQTGNIISKMDNHLNTTHVKAAERHGVKDNISQQQNLPAMEPNSQAASSLRTKRKDEFARMQASLSGWEQNVQPVDMEKAVLSLLESGQIAAAKQLQRKLSPSYVPQELVFIDVAIKLATLSSSSTNGETSLSLLDSDALSIVQSLNIPCNNNVINLLQALDLLVSNCGEGCGRALCRRIIAVLKAAQILGLSFSEAFEKQPVELLQLLSLKAQDSLEEAKLLVQTNAISAASIARILAESFLKGILAAHRGGYLDFQKEEGPAPLLWRSSDFLKWAELCPSESEVGHALMRLVLTGQEIPHACEVELLILSHHFYMSSACLDGVDVLVTFAANRVESYVLEGDFSCLARLITGVSNFRSLNFILNILIANGQLELVLQKYSVNDAATGTPASVRGFRMAVLTSLNYYTPQDVDAFSMVYNHFGMKHEVAALLESQSTQYIDHWFTLHHKYYQSDELLMAMRHLVETAEVLSTIDAGHRTHRACARASLLSLQIRIPDTQWINLEENNARKILVEQFRFQEALIVAEAYNLNHFTEWTPVFWNQMLKPDLVEQFVSEFVTVLPLHPSMLLELARFYRQEVAARGEQSHFSVWLSPGGLPAEFIKHLGRSFRSLLKRTRDLRLRTQLATMVPGFVDVIDACNKVLDKVPEGAGPLILRKGHGGAYLPLM